MTYRFNLHSDLHHENKKQYESCPKSPVPSAPNLLLAGDIDYSYRPNYRTFLHNCTDVYAKEGGHVYFIAGNHEAYNSNSYTDSLMEMNEIAAEKPNLHFLYRSKVQVSPKTVLLATTLHSYIPPHAEHEVAACMNDFHLIGDHSNKWTIADHNREHQKDVEWLGKTIEAIKDDQKIIVMTHHGPLRYGLSKPEHEGELRALRFAYQTDLTTHSWFRKIHTWISGHCHYNVDFKTAHGVRMISNQKGYKGECDGRKDNGLAYNANLVVEV